MFTAESIYTVSRCKEKQVELESKFAKLQRRINALRSFHVGNHAAKQIQVNIEVY